MDETEGYLAQLQVFVKQGVDLGRLLGFPSKCRAFSWLKLALQLHHFCLASAVFRFEDRRIPRTGYTDPKI